MLKITTALLALVSAQAFAALPAQAEGDSFVSCSGYHHGSYLEFYSSLDGTKVSIEVSNDGEPDENGWPVYEITKMRANLDVVAPTDYSKTLLQVVPAMKDGESEYPYVSVEATGPNGSKLNLNLKNYYGDNFLVIDGEVEPITCDLN